MLTSTSLIGFPDIPPPTNTRVPASIVVNNSQAQGSPGVSPSMTQSNLEGSGLGQALLQVTFPPELPAGQKFVTTMPSNLRSIPETGQPLDSERLADRATDTMRSSTGTISTDSRTNRRNALQRRTQHGMDENENESFNTEYHRRITFLKTLERKFQGSSDRTSHSKRRRFGFLHGGKGLHGTKEDAEQWEVQGSALASTTQNSEVRVANANEIQPITGERGDRCL